MSYEDIKVTRNGGFYIKSEDLFKNKKESLKTLKTLQKIFDKYKNKAMPYY